MTLTVETGTGGASSESYASVADADTYHGNLGNTLWVDLLLAEKEQALRRATIYMTQVYRMRWAGRRVTEEQALDWPRAYVPVVDVAGGYILSTIVPTMVRNACIELANSAAAGNLNPPTTQGVVSKEVGPIKVVYDRDSPRGTRFPAVDAMLAPFMAHNGNSMKLVRA